MKTPPGASSGTARSGSAKGFMAARRRRRQQLAVPPDLRWERLVVAADGADLELGATPVWKLALTNDGGTASETGTVFFSSQTVARDGALGTIDTGERWEFAVDGLDVRPPDLIWGYALARGGDGRWYARTVDGRAASFRSMPDELGVLRTLGLRMPLGAVPYTGEIPVGRAGHELPR